MGGVVERAVLEGEVVRLEPLDPAHVDALVVAAAEDRTHYGFIRVPGDAASMRAYVDAALTDERAGSALPFAARLVATARVVGTTRFLDLDYWTIPPGWPPGRPEATALGDPSAVEIGGTWLAASAQRTAAISEAKLLMLTHAFDRWAVTRVSFKTDARNTRSRRALERLGATFEGVRRAHTLAVDGSIRDSAYFSIPRSEWPDLRERLCRRLGADRGATASGPP